MTKEELDLILNVSEPDWIEENPANAAEFIKKMYDEIITLNGRLNNALEMIEPYHNIVLQLNKENKTLHKLLKG